MFLMIIFTFFVFLLNYVQIPTDDTIWIVFDEILDSLFDFFKIFIGLNILEGNEGLMNEFDYHIFWSNKIIYLIEFIMTKFCWKDPLCFSYP